MSLTIRPATLSDLLPLVDFQIGMAYETESLVLERSIVMEGVKAVLNDSSKGCYYVASHLGAVVGGLLVTYEWSDWRNGTLIWLQSVYVVPGFRRRGIFRSLFTHVQALINADSKYVGLRLYVERNNALAQNVYHQLGMRGNHYEVFEWYPAREAPGEQDSRLL